MEYLAKSKPIETIATHTQELIKRFHILKDVHADKLSFLSEKDWKLLEWAVLYHDVGKYNPVFQHKLRKAVGESELSFDLSVLYDLQHNLLSILAFPRKVLKLNKVERALLFQTIGFHHERERLDDEEQLSLVYDTYFPALKETVADELGIEIAEYGDRSSLGILKRRYTEIENGPDFYRYVLLKGLLHRLDHAASAHVPISIAPEANPGARTEAFIQRSFPDTGLNPLQQFSKFNRQHHVIAVAQTGMGKTEAGLLWIGDDKAFFTLPLRVSLNSMYKRLVNREGLNLNGRVGSIMDSGESPYTEEDFEGEEVVGLLHSTSLDYLEQMLMEDREKNSSQRRQAQVAKDEERLPLIHSATKEYANPLIVCTVDQILKFPLYYLGFEKEYATMAYSKVVIDELQAYSPEIAAILIRALVMIDRIGGSFMIMTATMPKIYKEALEHELSESRGEPTHELVISPQPFIDDTNLRHHIEVHEEDLAKSFVLERILEEGKTKSVLVICNTVNRSKEMFQALRASEMADLHQIVVRLLHSRFVRRHRAKLEERLLKFEQSKKTGIWITTQLVEASLDIDFDRLYTEMSVLDSQFQRYGRCNRRGKKNTTEANIHVFLGDASGVGSVYDENLYDKSVKLLKQHHGTVLRESIKQHMINELYDRKNLKNSIFLEKFDNALREIRDMTPYDMNRSEAQKIFRDIQEVQAVPRCLMQAEKIQRAMAVFNSSKSLWQQKKKSRKEIEHYLVGVNLYKAKKSGLLSPFPGIPDLYIIDAPYNSKTGLEVDKAAYSSLFL
ncbi:CRISPR-associated helicase/endonuclease Cas3 [Saccharibacillus endophyticus]|uniref:CRISPR-associated helicase/endonuclease Cas3 n=2 Tax=Saccharibacillus endophyticus TaxID=2060666 RepID=A0ABQ1ZSH6_9BACL|nr:CRISPR-associated helicase Cas3' [Saccharibacillus endophyticus]GGH78272.1 CRISPR-associated helicase/endonuclease Cas3 [Saccharibacillus endophyticus]